MNSEEMVERVGAKIQGNMRNPLWTPHSLARVAIAEYEACREETVEVEIQQMYKDARK